MGGTKMHEDERQTTRQLQTDQQGGKKPFALSQRSARILGAAAVLSMVAVIALIIIQGGFAKPSHISGMVYRGNWHRAAAASIRTKFNIRPTNPIKSRWKPWRLCSSTKTKPKKIIRCGNIITVGG